MKLATVTYGEKDVVVVRLDGDRLVEVNGLLSSSPFQLKGSAVNTMSDLIHGGQQLVKKIDVSLNMLAEEQYQEHIISMEQVTWRPPVPSPGKICGIALNNSASNERKISAPEHPAFFLKPASCLVGHQQPHTYPPLLRQRASRAGTISHHR